MRKVLLTGFVAAFAVLFISQYKRASIGSIYFPSYKKKNKPPKEQRIQAQIEERNRMLFNSDKGKVDPEDWYIALKEVLRIKNRISARSGDINWENVGPSDVGGRSRGFIFDNQNPNRCYASSVSGGIFVSDNLGGNWKPVAGLDEFPVLSIGCMAQSKDGDIYAGTGEYWGNEVNGRGGSMFFGSGIFKKSKDGEKFEILSFTFNSSIINRASGIGNFRRVIDIACDPFNNDKVIAATDNGMWISTNGGESWTKASGDMANGAISQIKPSHSMENYWYAGREGMVYRSTDGGATWQNLTGNNQNFVAESQFDRRHLRIAVSRQNHLKVYACGINSRGQMKFVILSEDGGNTWRKIGEQDALFQPLCQSDNSGCQGWYDLCMAVHPLDDDKLFVGGQLSLYSWSNKTQWIKAAFWNSPAKVGTNLVHADMHEFAFHPTNPDTMVNCNDGGIYLTTNASKNFPEPTFRPINNGLVTSQFYDIQANIYGDLIGGTQDNGTNFVYSNKFNGNSSTRVLSGDGFDAAFSAFEDSRVAFSSSQEGTIVRLYNGTETNVVNGSCAQGNEAGKVTGVNFNTRFHLAELLVKDEEKSNDSVDIDTVLKSLLFAFDDVGGVFIAPNIHNPKVKILWTEKIQLNTGFTRAMHQTSDLKTAYVAGTAGVRKLTNLDNITFTEINVNNKSCVRANGFNQSNIQLPSGVSNSNFSNVYVLQSNTSTPNVVLTKWGFANEDKVFYSTDGNSFVSKNGNLPKIPVYCAVIDETDPKRVIIGTEFGIWETKDITAASPIWEPASKSIGNVPVFKLRQVRLKKYGCWRIYAGTHGRGVFMADITGKDDCKSIERGRPKSTSSLSDLSSLNNKLIVYPNPATNVLNINFESLETGIQYIRIYSLDAKLVKSMEFKTLKGKNTISGIDVSFLSSGNYILRIENESKVIEGTKFYKN